MDIASAFALETEDWACENTLAERLHELREELDAERTRRIELERKVDELTRQNAELRNAKQSNQKKHYEVSQNVLLVSKADMTVVKLSELLACVYGEGFNNPYRAESSGDSVGLLSFQTARIMMEREKSRKRSPSGYSARISMCHRELQLHPSTSPAHCLVDKLLDHYSLYHDPAFVGLSQSDPAYGTTILELCAALEDTLRRDPALLRLEGPLAVMGDLHGSFPDLYFFIRHFVSFHSMAFTSHKLLFLGDYVDRGPASVEVAVFLLAMKCLAPQSVWLLRGNHEFAEVNSNVKSYGATCLLAQCYTKFGEELGAQVHNALNSVFALLPLAAVVDNAIFCVHGGIPRPHSEMGRTHADLLGLLEHSTFPKLNTFRRRSTDTVFLRAVKELANGLLWADPAQPSQKLDEHGFGPNPVRGEHTYCFGPPALDTFLEETGYQFVIRAHEVKQHGLRLCQHGRVLTVFTSSGYCGGDNAAGAVFLSHGKIRLISCLWEGPEQMNAAAEGGGGGGGLDDSSFSTVSGSFSLDTSRVMGDLFGGSERTSPGRRRR
eukprot:NODE_480_length_2199_cov_25.118140_g442_i0.p1 GENE.NODE_480_length_2199_cov_25.118140_g442_i0~~NODE_480_length_2199_cov_25.118140_g442_i0.p1  ORF type:complete len:550 (-),score=87.69 NODE_480_length_2199_cov_25.118140_g442_i0:292-1941(-)